MLVNADRTSSTDYADKLGIDWEGLKPPELQPELRECQRRLGALRGLMSPADAKPDVAMDRDQFDRWLRLAEEKAQLLKLARELWHPYRRK